MLVKFYIFLYVVFCIFVILIMEGLWFEDMGILDYVLFFEYYVVYV